MLTMGTVKLQNKVEKLSNVDVIDNIIDLVRLRTGKANGQLELLAEVDLKQAKTDRDQAKKSALSFESEFNDQNKSAKSQQQYFDALNENYLKEIKLGEARVLLETQVDSLESCLRDYQLESSTLESRLSELPEGSESMLNDKSFLLTKIRNNVIHGQTKVTEKAQLVSQVDVLEEWLEKVGRPNLVLEIDLDPKIELKEFELNETKEGLPDLILSVNSIQRDITALEAAEQDSACPTCKRAYEDKDDFDFEGQKKVLDTLLAGANMALVQHRKLEATTSAELDALLEQYPGEGHEQIIKDSETKLESAQSKLYTLADIITPEALEGERLSIEPLEAEVASLQNQVNARKEIDDRLVVLGQLSVNDLTNIKQYRFELGKLEEPSINLEATQATLVTLDGELNSLNGHLVQMNETKHALTTNLALAQQTLDLAQSTETKFNDLTGKVGLYKKLTEYLRSSRTRFLKTVWDGILSRATEIVSNATAGNVDQITQIGRDEKGNFFYCEKGEEFGMGDASGCQMEMMGVSLRLALCDCFYGNGSYMMLDEASSQMNDENAAALAGVLAATGKQIIYVTHRYTEEAASENVIILEAA